MPRTPISRSQRDRVQTLLDSAEGALRLATAERLNLDSVTRADINSAVDHILASFSALADQPARQNG